jgi:hypothetical protein
MTAVPDPAELAPTRDPAAYRRRPLLSAGFWVMLVFCALCLAAAVGVVTLGPRLFAPRQTAAAAPSVPATPAPSAYSPLPIPAGPTTAPPSPDVAGLTSRVQRLEGDEARALNAAAGALAAAALSDAAAGPRPFAAELAAFARLLPASPDALALAPLAAEGAPTRAALAVELSNIAAQVSVATHEPAKNAGFMDQLAYAISRVVNVRRVDARATGADAVLSRAERRAEDGDLEGAISLLDTLSPSARAALAPWRERAIRRIEIDDHIAGLRAQAVADLAAVKAAPS